MKIPTELEIFNNINSLIDFMQRGGEITTQALYYKKYGGKNIFNKNRTDRIILHKPGNFWNVCEISPDLIEVLFDYDVIIEDSGNFETGETHYHFNYDTVHKMDQIKRNGFKNYYKLTLNKCYTADIIKELTIIEREKKLNRILK